MIYIPSVDPMGNRILFDDDFLVHLGLGLESIQKGIQSISTRGFQSMAIATPKFGGDLDTGP